MDSETAGLLARRERVMGASYSHFYREPLYLVRGEGVWLFDHQGRRYLDCYNNVPSVGHCHPRVVEALARQAARLNTHTRYLHHAIIEYAEMLAERLPGELSVCTFVCTGTEANDLAYRIASTVTGRRGMIATADAYHGNSTLVSTWSSDREPPGGWPGWIAFVEAPDAYRGPIGRDRTDFAGAYAALVTEAMDELAARGHEPAMMIVDPIYDARGILTPEPAYLQNVCGIVREAGGLVVADEVQSGLCRLGEHFWGFEDSHVIPDIVTLGKPMGCGHPLAAVVTRPDIASAFAERTGYFNTFGGNPVSAEVGKAVLNVVDDEQILRNVGDTGRYFKAGLQRLADRHPLIGDVRGKGLFLGVELVEERATCAPAGAVAEAVAERMRQEGVLLARIGRHRNILKFRPPLVFGKSHADIALEALDQALAGARV